MGNAAEKLIGRQIVAGCLDHALDESLVEFLRIGEVCRNGALLREGIELVGRSRARHVPMYAFSDANHDHDGQQKYAAYDYKHRPGKDQHGDGRGIHRRILGAGQVAQPVAATHSSKVCLACKVALFWIRFLMPTRWSRISCSKTFETAAFQVWMEKRGFDRSCLIVISCSGFSMRLSSPRWRIKAQISKAIPAKKSRPP